MTAWINTIVSLVISGSMLVILAVACQLLPDSPFIALTEGFYLSVFDLYMPYIRYFLPIDEIVLILEAWVAVITQFWIWKIVYSVTKSVASSGTSIVPMK